MCHAVLLLVDPVSSECADNEAVVFNWYACVCHMMCRERCAAGIWSTALKITETLPDPVILSQGTNLQLSVATNCLSAGSTNRHPGGFASGEKEIEN